MNLTANTTITKDPYQLWSFRYSFEDSHRGRILLRKFDKQLSGQLLANFLNKVSRFMDNHITAISDSRASDVYEIKFTVDQDVQIYIDEVLLIVEQPITSANRDYLLTRLYRDAMMISNDYQMKRLTNYKKYELNK